MPPPADFLFPLSYSIDFLFCWKHAPIIGEIIENPEFAAQKEIFQKKHFFCPTITYSRLCTADHTYMKILFLAGFLRPGVIYSEKILGSVKNYVNYSRKPLFI